MESCTGKESSRLSTACLCAGPGLEDRGCLKGGMISHEAGSPTTGALTDSVSQQLDGIIFSHQNTQSKEHRFLKSAPRQMNFDVGPY